MQRLKEQRHIDTGVIAEGTLTGASPCILILDNEPDASDSLTGILETEGYRVVTAATADEARRVSSQNDLAVVLLAPKFDNQQGIELLDALRSAHRFSEGIILAGPESPDSPVDPIRNRSYSYLQKPFSPDEVRHSVTRTLGSVAMARELQGRLVAIEAANAEISESAKTLESRVANATALADQKIQELAQVNHQLVESQQQRDDFIAVLAHELAQPLTAITGGAQMLQRKIPEPAKQEIQSMVLREAHRMSRLVRNLADAATLMSDRFEVRVGTCDIVPLLQQQLAMIQGHSAQHTFRMEVLNSPAQILGQFDPDRITQVVSNLLSNAVRYSEGGEVRLTVAVLGDEVSIAVEDDGPGISPNRMANIFTSRFKLPLDEARTSKGMGLGLSITHAIVKAHGGSVSVCNNEGKGALFEVRLPLHQPTD